MGANCSVPDPPAPRDSPQYINRPNFMSNLHGLLPYFRPYRKRLAVAVVCSFASVSISLLVPGIIGRAIDDLYTGIDWGKLARYTFTIIGVSVAGGSLLFLHRISVFTMSRHIEHDLRHDLYRRLQQMPFSVFGTYSTGDLMTRLTGDVTAVRHIGGMVIIYTLQAVFVFVLTLPFMLRISPSLTLLLFLTMPLITWTAQYFGGRVEARSGEIQAIGGQISARGQENLTAVRLIRAYVREEAEQQQFERINSAYVTQSLQLHHIFGQMRSTMQFLMGIGFVLIIGYGGTLAINGEMTVGQFAEFNLYLARLIWPLIAAGNAITLYQCGIASLARINAIKNLAPEIVEPASTREQPPIEGRIEFVNLSFTYPGATAPVIRDIDLTIENGQTVAFVGRTGTGKSTLMSLIPRLFDPPPETVFVDGVSLHNCSCSWLRSSIGYVPQETLLFSDTLAENIAFGVDRADRKDIEWAAEIAGLTDDVRDFPDGFDTLVGERGLTLSGGQKQRTAIARALIKRPRILILDNALSNVDAYTEEKILTRLRKELRGRTSLIVSHRISAVRDADLICVMNQGRITERGTHDELLRLGGEYAALYEQELRQDEAAVA